MVGPIAGPVRERVIVLLADAVGGSQRRLAAERLVDDSVLVTALRSGLAVAAGCVALDGRAGRLTAIAVAAAWRGRGLGRAVVEAAFAELALDSLHAETDADAVGFYRSCGFSVVSLGEKYPGVERFAVTRTATHPMGDAR
jgi:ribosomal protein S18 acetylase RimI-like enzyme